MEKQLTINSQQIFYIDEGAGQPLIFLHGFCEDHTIWNDFRQPFLQHYRTIMPDLPGFGKSTLTENAGIEDMAEAVKAIVDKEQLARFVLIGHFMGGYVTLAFAEKYPEMPAGLGLFHSTCFADDEAKKENRLKVADFVLKNGGAPFVKELYGTLFSKEFAVNNQKQIDELINYASTFSPKGISNDSIAMRNRPDRSAVLKNSQAPVLFIIGRKDTVIPFAKSMQMVHFPNAASIHILEKTAHMGMFEEKEKAQQIFNIWLEVIFG